MILIRSNRISRMSTIVRFTLVYRSVSFGEFIESPRNNTLKKKRYMSYGNIGRTVRSIGMKGKRNSGQFGKHIRQKA